MRYRRLAAAGIAILLVSTAITLPATKLRAQAPFIPGSGATSSQQGITAVGQGTASLPPDKAIISASVQTNETVGPDALSENSRTVTAVVAAVKALGVSDADIRTSQLTLYPVYPQTATCPVGQTTYANGAVSAFGPLCDQPPSPPAVSYYEASEGITVTTTDLSKVPDLVQAMVSAGITTFSGVQFTWQNPEQLRTMAVQAASADAQQQAQALAASLGVMLGPVLSSSETYNSAPPVPTAVPAPPPPRPAPGGSVVPNFVPPLIQPGEQSANASVTVTYAIVGH